MNNSFDVMTKSSVCCVSTIATEASMLTSYPLHILPRSTTKWRVLHFTSTLEPQWQNRPKENNLTKSQGNILSLQIFLTEQKTEKYNPRPSAQVHKPVLGLYLLCSSNHQLWFGRKTKPTAN